MAVDFAADLQQELDYFAGPLGMGVDGFYIDCTRTSSEWLLARCGTDMCTCPHQIHFADTDAPPARWHRSNPLLSGLSVCAFHCQRCSAVCKAARADGYYFLSGSIENRPAHQTASVPAAGTCSCGRQPARWLRPRRRRCRRAWRRLRVPRTPHLSARARPAAATAALRWASLSESTILQQSVALERTSMSLQAAVNAQRSCRGELPAAPVHDNCLFVLLTWPARQLMLRST